MVATASPSVTRPQFEPALICEEKQGISGRPASSGVLWWCQLSCTVLFFKHRSHSRLLGSHATVMEFVSSRSLEVILFALVGWCPSIVLSRSPGVSFTHLKLCWETHQNFLSWHIWMCHPGGAVQPVHRLQVSHATHSDKDIRKSKAREKSLRKD